MGYYKDLMLGVMEDHRVGPGNPRFDQIMKAREAKDCREGREIQSCSKWGCRDWLRPGCVHYRDSAAGRAEQRDPEAMIACRKHHGMRACSVMCEAWNWPECLVNKKNR